MSVIRRLALLIVLAAGTSSALAEDPAGKSAPGATPDVAKLVVAMKSKDRAERLAAAETAKAMQDDKLHAPLVLLLDDEDLTVRKTAVEALAARTSPDARKKAAAALVPHLARTSKKSELEIEEIATAHALGVLAQPSSVDPLMDGVNGDATADVVRARLLAVANLPCAEAVEALVQFLARQGRGRGGEATPACRQALKEATGEDFGADPDKWRAWWRDAKKDFDYEAAAKRRRDAETKKREKKKDGKKDGGDGKK